MKIKHFFNKLLNTKSYINYKNNIVYNANIIYKNIDMIMVVQDQYYINTRIYIVSNDKEEQNIRFKIILERLKEKNDKLLFNNNKHIIIEIEKLDFKIKNNILTFNDEAGELLKRFDIYFINEKEFKYNKYMLGDYLFRNNKWIIKR